MSRDAWINVGVSRLRPRRAPESPTLTQTVAGIHARKPQGRPVAATSDTPCRHRHRHRRRHSAREALLPRAGGYVEAAVGDGRGAWRPGCVRRGGDVSAAVVPRRHHRAGGASRAVTPGPLWLRALHGMSNCDHRGGAPAVHRGWVARLVPPPGPLWLRALHGVPDGDQRVVCSVRPPWEPPSGKRSCRRAPAHLGSRRRDRRAPTAVRWPPPGTAACSAAMGWRLAHPLRRQPEHPGRRRA
jgi:hypothetical protein